MQETRISYAPGNIDYIYDAAIPSHGDIFIFHQATFTPQSKDPVPGSHAHIMRLTVEIGNRELNAGDRITVKNIPWDSSIDLYQVATFAGRGESIDIPRSWFEERFQDAVHWKHATEIVQFMGRNVKVECKPGPTNVNFCMIFLDPSVLSSLDVPSWHKPELLPEDSLVLKELP